MIMNKLLFISITAIGSLFCSCNSYLDKPIYEPLTVEELKKLLKKMLHLLICIFILKSQQKHSTKILC